MLDALGTQAALETLVDRTRTRPAPSVQCTIDLAYESGRASTRHVPSLEAGIYRIAQEAITNAVKHAQATRLILTVNEGAETVALSVEDNGCGFEAADRSNGGFGLIGMRERVELLGGKLEVMSRAGGGTRVDVAVPVQRRDADPTGESAPERAAGSAAHHDALAPLASSHPAVRVRSLRRLIRRHHRSIGKPPSPIAHR